MPPVLPEIAFRIVEGFVPFEMLLRLTAGNPEWQAR